MPIYFISDLHLSDDHPHLLKLFSHFINNILKPGDILYILGDLFEYWIGDDQYSETINTVKKLLHALEGRRIHWYFLAGNRDFLLGKKFLAATHGILLPEQIVIKIDDARTLLLHGDTLCTLDLPYQAWRKKINNQWIQKLFLLLPLSIRSKIAQRMRQKSNQHVHQLHSAIMDVAEITVQEQFLTYHSDVIIHGHVHRPGIHAYWNQTQLSWQYRYVLADWDHQGNYLLYDRHQFTLCYFDIPTDP